MGCLSKPKLPGPSAQERTLAQVAMDQYQVYKNTVVPLQDAEIKATKEIRSPGERLRSIERGANQARVSLTRPSGPVSQNQRGLVLDANRYRAQGIARGAAGGDLANKGRSLQRQTNILSLGRGISTAGSSMARRSAAFGAGNEAAETTAHNMVTNTKLNLLGQAAGAVAGYGVNEGWFDNVHNTTRVPKRYRNNWSGGLNNMPVQLNPGYQMTG